MRVMVICRGDDKKGKGLISFDCISHYARIDPTEELREVEGPVQDESGPQRKKGASSPKSPPVITIIALVIVTTPPSSSSSSMSSSLEPEYSTILLIQRQ
jgi:hypothetical protein